MQWVAFRQLVLNGVLAPIYSVDEVNHADVRRKVSAHNHDVGEQVWVFGQELCDFTILHVTRSILWAEIKDVLEEIEKGPYADNPGELAPNIQLIVHLADAKYCLDIDE